MLVTEQYAGQHLVAMLLHHSVKLEIISVDLVIDNKGNGQVFTTIEVLKTNLVDHKTNRRIEGIVGNNFSLMCEIMILAQAHG